MTTLHRKYTTARAANVGRRLRLDWALFVAGSLATTVLAAALEPKLPPYFGD